MRRFSTGDNDGNANAPQQRQQTGELGPPKLRTEHPKTSEHDLQKFFQDLLTKGHEEQKKAEMASKKGSSDSSKIKTESEDETTNVEEPDYKSYVKGHKFKVLQNLQRRFKYTGGFNDATFLLWKTDIEEYFQEEEFPRNRWVHFALQVLQGPALRLYQEHRAHSRSKPLTWDSFLTIFHSQQQLQMDKQKKLVKAFSFRMNGTPEGIVRAFKTAAIPSTERQEIALTEFFLTCAPMSVAEAMRAQLPENPGLNTVLDTFLRVAKYSIYTINDVPVEVMHTKQKSDQNNAVAQHGKSHGGRPPPPPHQRQSYDQSQAKGYQQAKASSYSSRTPNNSYQKDTNYSQVPRTGTYNEQPRAKASNSRPGSTKIQYAGQAEDISQSIEEQLPEGMQLVPPEHDMDEPVYEEDELSMREEDDTPLIMFVRPVIAATPDITPVHTPCTSDIETINSNSLFHSTHKHAAFKQSKTTSAAEKQRAEKQRAEKQRAQKQRAKKQPEEELWTKPDYNKEQPNSAKELPAHLVHVFPLPSSSNARTLSVTTSSSLTIRSCKALILHVHFSEFAYIVCIL